MMRVHFINSVRLLRMGVERPFLDTDGICYTENGELEVGALFWRH